MRDKLISRNHSLRIKILELKEEIARLKSENKSLRKCFGISGKITGDDIETILANLEIQRLDRENEELRRKLKEI